MDTASQLLAPRHLNPFHTPGVNILAYMFNPTVKDMASFQTVIVGLS